MIKRAWFWLSLLSLLFFLGALNFSPQFKKNILDISRGFFYIPDFVFNFFINSRELVLLQRELEEENQALKAKLFNYEKEAGLVQAYNRFKYIEAQVYSRYPFNNKDYLMINRGSNEGLEKNLSVTMGESILIGKIKDVFKYSSGVKTIFNSDWQFGVRIRGDGGDSEALLEGGNNPRLIYIDKKVEIKSGDVIYSVSEEFPYGLRVGNVNEISLSEDRAFREATILLPYNIRDLRNLLVVLNK